MQRETGEEPAMIGRFLSRAAFAIWLLLAWPGAQAQVVITQSTAKPVIRTTPRVCFGGDSLTQFSINNSGNIRQWSTSSYITPLRWLLRGRMIISQAQVYGVSSTTSAHLLATQVPQIIGGGCDIALIQDGTNDPTNGITAAQTVANLQAAAATLNAQRIWVVFIAIAPQSGWSQAQRQQIAEVNRQLFAMSLDPSRRVRFVDINPVYTDYGTGNALAGYQFSDNVHDSPVGGFVKAQLIATAVDDLVPKLSELLPLGSADAYHATLNPTGNLLTNGILAGTGGNATFGGATGQAPTNWQIGFESTGGSTMTIASAKGTLAGNSSIPTSVITFGGTGDARFMRMNAQSVAGTNAVTIPAGVVAGDRLEASCEVAWSGMTNFRYLALRLQASDGTTTWQNWDGGTLTPSGTSSLPMVPTMPSIIFTTPELVVPTGMTGLFFFLEAAPVVGAAVSGTVTVDRCSLRKK
jgi:hypothetical protein